MDRLDGDQVRALLLIEGIQVGLMLEVVGVDLALLGDRVGLDVVGELFHLERVALLLELIGHGVSEDLGVRGRACGDGDGLVVGAGVGTGACATGQDAGGQDACSGERRELLQCGLLHVGSPSHRFALGPLREFAVEAARVLFA